MVFFLTMWYYPSPSSLPCVKGSGRPYADDHAAASFFAPSSAQIWDQELRPDDQPGEVFER